MNARLLGAAAAAAFFYANAVASADGVDMTTLNQAYYTATTTVDGVSPYYTQSASPNSLTVSSLPNLPPPPPTQFYNTQNLTPFQLSGDFSASVTVIPGANLEGGAGGGLQAQFQSGTGGFSSGNIFGQDISANYGFGPAVVNTSPILNSSSSVVFDLQRVGDVFNVSASTDHGFVNLVSLTGSNVSAPVVLDLVANVAEGTVEPQTLTFTNFYVLGGSGGALELTGGTATDPIPLPSSTVGSISGDIGGASPSSDYYSFYWTGGEFEASVGVADAAELIPQPAYTFELCEGTSCADVLQTTTADSENAWQSSLSGNLAQGYYTVGIIDNSSTPDPSFSITFDTPISQLTSGVPEPSTWAMLLLGFAGLGYAGYRKTKNERTAIA
jgi:PEP-CTERM motif